MKYVGKYNYDELREDATSPEATQEDINALGEWFSQYGEMYWNGEYYDAEDGLCLYPLYKYNHDSGDVEYDGYTFSNSDWWESLGKAIQEQESDEQK